MMVIIVLD